MRGQDGLLLPGRRGEAGGDHEAALHSIGSVQYSTVQYSTVQYSTDHEAALHSIGSVLSGVATCCSHIRNKVTVFPRK